MFELGSLCLRILEGCGACWDPCSSAVYWAERMLTFLIRPASSLFRSVFVFGEHDVFAVEGLEIISCFEVGG